MCDQKIFNPSNTKQNVFDENKKNFVQTTLKNFNYEQNENENENSTINLNTNLKKNEQPKYYRQTELRPFCRVTQKRFVLGDITNIKK